MFKSNYILMILAAVLLIPAAHAQYDDKEIWESVQCSSKSEVLGFVQNFPESRYIGEADKCFWENSVDCSNKAQLIEFISLFPGGQNFQKALQCLEQIEVVTEQNQISRQLLNCEALIAAGRLTKGVVNALECYQSVLQEFPGNEQALNGLNRIEEVLAGWVREALSNGQIEQAKQDLAELKRLNPRYPSIPQLQTAILQNESRTASQQIVQLLAQCNEHLIKNRLTIGEGGNAWDCFREVLALDPNNIEAQNGLMAVKEQYVIRIRVAVANGDLALATNLLERLKRLQPLQIEVGALEALITARSPTVELQPMCEGAGKGAQCWKKVANKGSKPGCYVWEDYHYPAQTVTWSGSCTGSIATGYGTEVWTMNGESNEQTGTYVDGKKHGQWAIHFATGANYKGPYETGKKHGQWVERYANRTVAEGTYVNGERNGPWEFQYPEGVIQKGRFDNDKRNGDWVFRYPNRDVLEGAYVNGKKNGSWVRRDAGQQVIENTEFRNDEVVDSDFRSGNT